MVYGLDNSATHYLEIDGDAVTYTNGYDPDDASQSGSTSLVLHLQSGQELGVDPLFSGTIKGSTSKMYTLFGATLLYAD